MIYFPQPTGNAAVDLELNRLALCLKQTDVSFFVKTNVAPSKPVDGETRYADGTNWNPGSGEGVYTYYASAWHKLG